MSSSNFPLGGIEVGESLLKSQKRRLGKRCRFMRPVFTAGDNDFRDQGGRLEHGSIDSLFGFDDGLLKTERCYRNGKH